MRCRQVEGQAGRMRRNSKDSRTLLSSTSIPSSRLQFKLERSIKFHSHQHQNHLSSKVTHQVLPSFLHPSFFFQPQGDLVDIYVPRKCAATGRLIEAKDHASVQIAVGDVDAEGKIIPGSNTTFALSGYVRNAGEADDSLNRLATKEGREYLRSRVKDELGIGIGELEEVGDSGLGGDGDAGRSSIQSKQGRIIRNHPTS